MRDIPDILDDLSHQFLQCVVDELDCTGIGAPECHDCQSGDCTQIRVVPDVNPSSPCCGTVFAWVSETNFHGGDLNRLGTVDCNHAVRASAVVNVRVRRCIACMAGNCDGSEHINNEIDPDTIVDDALAIHIDHWAVTKAMACFVRKLEVPGRRKQPQYIPGTVRRTGGACCVGVDASLTVDVPAALCCCPIEPEPEPIQDDVDETA